jgi:DNA repair ATPase RecN
MPNSLADKFKRWGQLGERAKLVLDQAPGVAPNHKALEEELARLVALEHEHGSITAKLRKATRLRDEAAERVRKLRNRVVAGLQAHFGPESEELIEYGVSPRKRRVRRKAERPPEGSGGGTAPPGTTPTAAVPKS